MNILRNMEVVFIVAVALSCATAFAAAPAPGAQAGGVKMINVAVSALQHPQPAYQDSATILLRPVPTPRSRLTAPPRFF